MKSVLALAGFAEAAIGQLRHLMHERNVYRGRVLALAPRHFHGDEGAR